MNISYVPLRTGGEGRRLEIELRSLFRRFERNENVAARYRTVALIGAIRRVAVPSKQQP